MIKRFRRHLEEQFLKAWYGKTGLTTVMRPVSWLYCAVVNVRRVLYYMKFKKSFRLNVPVIVVGNITIGGTGKTPLVIWLSNLLKEKGYNPGVITRGYGGRARNWPQQVRPDGDPVVVGDESILISQRTGVPMAAGPDRVSVAQSLMEFKGCNVIISDDGLQHYKLRRDIEIAVIDGSRRFGNGYCLPAGPLREQPKRLDKVDFVVTNGTPEKSEFGMRYIGTDIINLAKPEHRQPIDGFKGKQIHAVAGIGNPDRFFEQLGGYGMQVIPHPFSDHHPYTAEELVFDDDLPVIMTEKDAVKCRRFAEEKFWYLPVEVEMDGDISEQILERLKNYGQKTT